MMCHISQVDARIGPAGRGRGQTGLGLVLRVVLSVVGVVGGSHQAAGQGPDSTHVRSAAPSRETSPVLATLPPPLMTTTFPQPTSPIDVQHFQMWEDCLAEFGRRWGTTEYAVVQTMHNARTTDTSSNWHAPFFPPTMFQDAHTCLRRFRVATVWPELLDQWRMLAIGLSDDSLLQAVVAAQFGGGPAPLLASVIRDLSGKYITAAIPAQVWGARRRAYLAQLDALGPSAVQERLSVRNALLEDESGLDSTLALLRDELHLLQQPQVAALPEMQSPSGIGTLTVGAAMQQAKQQQIQRLLQFTGYMQTLSPDSLAALAQSMPVMWLHDVPAPVLHCDYYFPTSRTTPPHAGPAPVLPAPGMPALLVIGAGLTDGSGPFLRRIHQQLPTLPIIYESSVTGVVQDAIGASTNGSFGRFFGDNRTQEAVFRHQTLADSLGWPGAFCAANVQVTKNADGYAYMHADPNKAAYHLMWNATGIYIVDPTGKILGKSGGNPGDFGYGIVYGDPSLYAKRFEELVLRVAAKYGVKAARPSPPPR